MFIRVVKKQNTKDGKVFLQFMLCQSSRIGGKVKQHHIFSLGSDQELADKVVRNEVLEILKAKIFGIASLFPTVSPLAQRLADIYFKKFQAKFADVDEYSNILSTPPKSDGSDYQEIDLASLEVVESKSFGAENICIKMFDELGLDNIFASLGWEERNIQMAKLSIISRAIYGSSENKTAQILEQNSALKSLLGIDKKITHRDLYPVLDQLFLHKSEIDKALYKNIQSLFNIDTSIIIYDLSNLYFEGRKANSKIAKFGRSKEKRNDCKQVVFTGIIDSEGFIKHSRVYEGNMADCNTINDLLEDFAKQGVDINNVTIVMDAGFATKENLDLLEKKGIKYVSVARNKIKNYEIDSEKELVRVYDKNQQPIDLQVFRPAGQTDTWMYVKSEQKRIKESSMAQKLEQRLEEDLQALNEGLSKKGATKNHLKVAERIGRIKQKHKLVSGRYEINMTTKEETALAISWTKKEPKQKLEADQGVYFIRTNYTDTSEEKLWNVYNIIREVESTFRCLKSDLMIRPVYHQKDTRIEGHIYQTILGYQIVNAIRYHLKKHDINHDWRNIVRILSTQTLNDIKLPTKTKQLIVTKPSTPIAEVKEIYNILKFKFKTKIKKKYVVYH